MRWSEKSIMLVIAVIGTGKDSSIYSTRIESIILKPEICVTILTKNGFWQKKYCSGLTFQIENTKIQKKPREGLGEEQKT